MEPMRNAPRLDQISSAKPVTIRHTSQAERWWTIAGLAAELGWHDLTDQAMDAYITTKTEQAADAERTACASSSKTTPKSPSSGR